MNGEQQTPQKKENQEKEPRMCTKDHLHESDGCPECCCQNGSYVVQVSILHEVPPNKRKRNETLRKLVEVVRFAFIIALAFLAIGAIDSVDTGNIFMDLAIDVSLYCFVCYGLCMALFRLLDKILDV